jgi:NAD(P)-dependent dehydrogenase (short-subunit alcohol dehydrogenase family)
MELKGLLSGKNVLVTGAGRNIGRSIAIEMAGQGANIFFAEIDKESCTRLEAELKEYQVLSKGFVSDVSNSGDIDKLCRTLQQDQINIDVLVNNVGIHYTKKKTQGRNLEEWKEVFNTNVFGPMSLTNLISQMMIDHRIHGSIIFITSIHQWVISRDSSYSSSKAALGMIIKELALSLAPHKIRVNGIAPGYVGEDRQRRPLHHPYTPLYESSINPCYIGRTAVYLASDYFSKFTTGTVIKIDAGLSLYNHLVEQFPPK